jgi:hypothetical protein
MSAEKSEVIAAITKLGGSVTAADVATETGLSPDRATQNLNLIASETGGRLQVSKDGNIAYSFQPGFAGKYLSHGLQLIVLNVLKRVFQIGYFLLRISFGLGLMLSLGVVLLFTMPSLLGDIFSAEIGGLFGKEGKKKTRKKASSKAQSEQLTVRAKASSQFKTLSDFSLKCFSFLFGDGNPNEHLDDERWRLIARKIRAKGYAVTSDELSPYTGKKPDDEDAVLPVLVRFVGTPEVTKSGNIVYLFPSLTKVAADEQQQDLPLFLEENLWKFSSVSEKDLQNVRLLAGLNFLGTWGLWFWSFHARGWQLPAPLFNLLVLYGTAFLALPLARYQALKKMNMAIAKRNDERRTYANRLEAPKKDLKKKLAEASSLKLETSHIGDKDIVYTTDKDLLDQPDELDEQFKGA